MPTRMARAIREPIGGDRIILAPPSAPAMRGNGNTNIVCGACGTVLIERVHPHLRIGSMVIRCPNCKQCNDTE
jgi:predicted RNA-binding Zn-ribbon protein involved in translation (DUF1610 family)